MFGMLYDNYCMEIAEVIGWIALGFLPMFGSMEVVWRLGKRRSFKPITKKGAIIKKVSVVDVLRK
jgi:uncharacterized membrane protein